MHYLLIQPSYEHMVLTHGFLGWFLFIQESIQGRNTINAINMMVAEIDICVMIGFLGMHQREEVTTGSNGRV